MNIIYEIVGVLGFITNVWANLLIARKSESGWIVRLVANVLWLAYGLAIVSIANILSSIVFGGINVYGLRRWRKERFMTKACEDHYRQDCKFCRNVVRQCRCHIGTDKPVTRDGICGVCAAQLDAAQFHAIHGADATIEGCPCCFP